VQSIRSRGFDALLIAWTAMFLPALVLLLVLGRPTRPIRATSRVWARGILFC
jgi:1-acyl-sn-glycerol-3-phosphate acyltransferase